MTVEFTAASSHSVEADVELHNRDLSRSLTITAVHVDPAPAVRLVALRLVNASAPFNGRLSGSLQLGAPVSIAADTVQTIRMRFAITGRCRQALRADPPVSITSHYQGQASVTTTSVPRAASGGWIVRSCPHR